GGFPGTAGSIYCPAAGSPGAVAVAWSRSRIFRAVRRPDSLAAQFVFCSQGFPVFRG
nr:hypothetical protein [Tanacetum cinerariifolium]